VAAELPFRSAEALPLPVDDAEPKSRRDPAGKARPPSVREAELPAGGEEKLDEVFPVVPGEREPALLGDRSDECARVVNVVKP
jgi:predicted transcriptional regulator